jgi:hypothetical protein
MLGHVHCEEERGEGVQRGEESEDDCCQPGQVEDKMPGPGRARIPRPEPPPAANVCHPQPRHHEGDVSVPVPRGQKCYQGQVHARPRRAMHQAGASAATPRSQSVTGRRGCPDAWRRLTAASVRMTPRRPAEDDKMNGTDKEGSGRPTTGADPNRPTKAMPQAGRSEATPRIQ